MNNRQKWTLTAAFLLLLILAGAMAVFLNQRAVYEGVKQFQIEVISERDEYSEIMDCKSSEEYLGQYLRTMEGCEWQDAEYGLYITGFYGMSEDLSRQYWWCVYVNHEDSTLGADAIPLADGNIYTFRLMQGW